MLALYQIIVLALVQGITEFLPISSSGHLVITSQLMGWPDQGLTLDIAVHIGTLLAVMLYFWRDLGALFVGLGRTVTHRRGRERDLFLNVVIASIPVLAVGWFAKDYVEQYFRSVELIAWTTIGFGILLWIADRVGLTVRRVEHIGWGGALVIGLSQILALVPGTSRSGITMTVARFLGMERGETARFSMLVSIPVIGAIGGYTALEVVLAGNLPFTLEFGLAVGLSFLAALVAIWAMMAWLRHASFTIFAVYRIVLGAFLLWWVYA